MCVISLADVPSRVWKYSFWPSAILQDVLDHGIDLKYANGRLYPFLYLNMWTRSDAVYVRSCHFFAAKLLAASNSLSLASLSLLFSSSCISSSEDIIITSIGVDFSLISVMEGISFGESSWGNENCYNLKICFLYIYFYLYIFYIYIYVYIVHNLTLARSEGSHMQGHVAQCPHSKSVHPQQQCSHLKPTAVRWQKKSARWLW